MSRIEKFKGIFPAFYACYDDNGNVSEERSRDFARYLIDKGVNGLYVGGSSGECIYQNLEERKKTLKAVMEAVGGKTVIIAHIACTSTRDSMELAAYAESLGVDAIAAIPPIYFHLPEYAIAEYWNSISAAAPKTPFIIYNVPDCAGVALTPGLLQEMLKNPMVIGVKNTTLRGVDLRTFKNMGGEDFVIFNGPDEQYASGRIMGADSGIGGTYGAMPELLMAVDKYLAAGDFDTVRKLQSDIFDIITVLCSGHSNMYAVIKEYLRSRCGINIGGVRAPLTAFAEQDRKFVDQAAEMIEAAKKKYVK